MGAAGKNSKSAELICLEGVAHCGYLEELARLRSELKALAREVRTDALTGLFNYRYFTELLDHEVERSRRNGLPLALIMVDLDRFKQLNDRWGHETGNQALVHVAGILRRGVRRIDAACRYGGEELVLLLPGTAIAKAAKVAERLRRDIEGTPLVHEGGEIEITASLGVAVFPDGGAADAAELVQQADAFLYRAKEQGRNRVCHPPIIPKAPETQVTQEEKRALLD